MCTTIPLPLLGISYELLLLLLLLHTVTGNENIRMMPTTNGRQQQLTTLNEWIDDWAGRTDKWRNVQVTTLRHVVCHFGFTLICTHYDALCPNNCRRCHRYCYCCCLMTKYLGYNLQSRPINCNDSQCDWPKSRFCNRGGGAHPSVLYVVVGCYIIGSDAITAVPGIICYKWIDEKCRKWVIQVMVLWHL